VIEKYLEMRSDSRDKASLLREMVNVKGVYVPALYIPYKPKNSPLFAVKPVDSAPPKIKKRILSPFHQAPFPEDIVVPHIKVIFDRVAFEVARGCPQKCRFCQASSIYFPPRIKSPSSVISGVLKSLRSTGYEDVSLTGLSVSDYPYLEGVIRSLMTELEKQKISLSLSSIRPKGLSSEIVQNIVKVRRTGFTLVPEAGSQRLRSVINKKLVNDEIWEAVENAFSEGWTLLKLYFMIGLPTEREEDLVGIVHLVEEIIGIGRRVLKKSPQIHLSIASFIPKPHTPFQWLRMEEKDVLNSKYRYLLSRLKRYRFVRLKKSSLESSILEAVFSRGDRELNRVLHQAWQEGARFDSWNDIFRFQTWEKAFERESIDYRTYLLDLDRKSNLPWDHIDTGIKKSHLLEELNLALKDQDSPTCMERKCAECQGCTLSGFYQKRFNEQVPVAVTDTSILGKRTKEVQRYRASYRKTDTARFLSHMDVHTIIQQGFRRSGVSVSYTHGFHPKMQMIFPPALPLGMEGRREWIEFTSMSRFSENEFMAQVNKFLPQGICFTGLLKMDQSQPKLSQQIKALIYSLDLSREDVRKATEDLAPWKSRENYYGAVKSLMDVSMKELKLDSIIKAMVDTTKAKLLLYIKPDFHKSHKPQQIIERIFQLSNPVFLMSREEILFHD
jgi:radical SAM-linked protein